MTNEPDDLRTEQGSAEAVFAAWAVRVENGEQLAFEDLVRAHPAHAEEFLRLHEDWKLFAPLLGKVVPGLIASSTGIKVAPLSGGDDDDPGMPSAELLDRLGIHAPNTGRYRFRAVLGRGGGGVVLKVWDTKLNRPLAMKVVLGRGEDRPTGDTPKVDSRTLMRFVDEARIASQLNHPGIVPVHELGADESGRAFFTMKLVKGEDLSKIFEHVKTGHDGWNQTRALGVLLKVCEAMSFAHAKGVIHRDLKPANVMVGRYGEVHVMDWGLARVLGEKDHRDLRIRPPERVSASAVDSLRGIEREGTPNSPLITMDGAVVGTPAYMSPEQARGELDAVGPRSDVYAIGAMLYQLIAGQVPFIPLGARASPRTVLMRVIEGPPKALEELAPRAPVELVAICERAMEREPEDRYVDTLAFSEDLRAYLEHRVVQAYETGTWAETKKWVQRNRSLAASLIGTIAILIAGIWTALLLARDAQEQTRLAGLQARAADESRDEAQRERNAAELARTVSELRERAARRSAYAAHLRNAHVALFAEGSQAASRYLTAAPPEYRSWEWSYLTAALDRSLLVLRGHEGSITACAFSLDGERAMTLSDDGSIRMWDVRTGSQINRVCLGTPDETIRGTFSPDGLKVLASVSRDVGVHETATGARLFQIPNCATHEYYRDALLWRFTPDGSQMLLRADRLGVLDLRDAQIGQFPRGVPDIEEDQYPTGGYIASSFDRDGSLLLTVSPWDKLLLWDTSVNAPLLTGPRTLHVSCCALKGDGTLLLTCSGLRGEVRNWAWELSSTLSGHNAAISDCTFSPDDKTILTSSADRTSRIWDPATGRELVILRGHDAGVLKCLFSQDGTRIITASEDQTARIWDPAMPPDPHVLGPFVTFNPDAEESIVPVEGPAVGTPVSVAFSPDSSRLFISSPSSLRIWNLLTGDLLANWLMPKATTSAFAVHPNGGSLAIAGENHDFDLRDSITGEVLAQVDQGAYPLVGLLFSPDGASLFLTSYDADEIWNVAARSRLVLPRADSGPRYQASCADFSTDCTKVLTGYKDGTVRIWDAETATRLREFRCRGPVAACAFSPDGSSIVTADGVAPALWNATSGEWLFELRGHLKRVTACSFDREGSRIMTGSEDGTIRIWDVMTGLELLVLRAEGSVSGCCFSPDGTTVMASTFDGFVRLWDSVPWRDRFHERTMFAEAAPRARVTFDRVSAGSRSLQEVGTRLREDAQLDSRTRMLALDLLLQVANEVHQAAALLVQDAIASYGLRDEVLHYLEREPSLSQLVRSAAIELTRSQEDSTDSLNQASWSIVSQPNRCPEEYLRALHWAEKAVVLAKEDWQYPGDALNTLAVAHYRVGALEQALTTFESWQQCVWDFFPKHVEVLVPEHIAFLAMTQHRLGMGTDAQESFELLQTIVQWDEEPEVRDRAQSLMHETTAVIAEPVPNSGSR